MKIMQKPSLDPPSLTIFFPAYNEEANVERVIAAALHAAEGITDNFEIIIVNDGSKDRTGELADKLAAQFPQVRAVHNNPNLGYGGALQRGFREATKDWVFYTDGDGQFDFAQLPEAIKLLERCDIVSGYRLDRKDSLIRRINAAAWSALVNLMFSINLKDIDCAFKIYPKHFIDSIEMRSMGALIDTEMLAKARRMNYSVEQLGVHHYARIAGEQSGANLRVILRAFKELFQLRRHITKGTP